ncbi:MAG: hypothetical protein WCW52_08560 [Elusimicrobiales bacterium]|jgi:hypothetical protein
MTRRTAPRKRPEFGKRMTLLCVGQAFVVASLTYAITIGWTVYSTNPTLAGYIRVFVRPALLVSAAVGFLISCLAGLVFYRRIAGPVYSFKNVVDAVTEEKEREIAGVS